MIPPLQPNAEFWQNEPNVARAEYPAGLTGVPDGRLLSSIAAQSGVARLMAGETWCSDRSAGIG